MNKIEKFLRKLSKKERSYLLKTLLPKIHNLELKGLEVTQLKGYPLWKVRHGKIRILFIKSEKSGVIVRIGFRKDVYNKL